MATMDKIRETQKKYCSRALTTAIIICMVMVMAGHPVMGKGLLLGTIFSIINFILMGETLSARVGGGPKKAFAASLGSIALRYLLMAIPMVVAIKGDSFDLLFTVIGVFSVQILIMVDHVLLFFTVTRTQHHIKP
ncbi:MAG: ATP synthase subunit I [Thermodesulfobacteriota bacterium]|nr:ATP synthase subunit I [Thermodesulfobacteriota bacterium]